MGATADILQRLGVESELVAWARARREELPSLWSSCPRGDWLVQLAVAVGVDRRCVVAAAADCVRMVQRVLPDDERCAARVIGEAEKWVRAEATGAECMAAAFAAAAAGRGDDAVSAAMRAAAALGFACDADADDSYYASAGHAAEAVRLAAQLHSRGAAAGHAVCAELVRERVDGRTVLDRVHPALRASGLPPVRIPRRGESGITPTGFGAERT